MIFRVQLFIYQGVKPRLVITQQQRLGLFFSHITTEARSSRSLARNLQTRSLGKPDDRRIKKNKLVGKWMVYRYKAKYKWECNRCIEYRLTGHQGIITPNHQAETSAESSLNHHVFSTREKKKFGPNTTRIYSLTINPIYDYVHIMCISSSHLVKSSSPGQKNHRSIANW